MEERIWVKFVALALAAAVVGGCSKSDDKAGKGKAESITVTLAPVQVRDVQRQISVVGTLYGAEEATISAKVGGRVLSIEKDLGDRVNADGILARIDPVDYELAVVQKETALLGTLARLGLEKLPDGTFDVNLVPTVVKAKSQVDNATGRLQRGKQLFQQTPPLMSEQEYADLDTAYRVAKGSLDVEVLTVKSLLAEAKMRKSELDSAKQKIADAVIRVPSAAASYVVGARMVSAGEYVREGDKMFKVVANNPMKYRAQVPERYMSETKAGQKVEVGVSARAEVFDGVVTRISPQIDVATRMYQLEATVDNASGLLTSGSFARGRILTKTESNVKFVPMDAVVTFVGTTKIFTVRDGKAAEILVETGVRQGMDIEVTGELDGVESVVTTGATRVSTGMPVTVKEAAAADANDKAAENRTGRGGA
jgi:RND family efflux transporter MFP subunit